MKKHLITLMMLILALASCEDYPEDYCPHATQSSRTNGQQVLTVKKLIGTWQCSYDMRVGTTELKQIRFINETECEIIESELYSTDWTTYSYAWTAYGGYIKFARNSKSFSFKIDDYIWPEVYLRDSFGRYTIKKCY